MAVSNLAFYGSFRSSFFSSFLVPLKRKEGCTKKCGSTPWKIDFQHINELSLAQSFASPESFLRAQTVTRAGETKMSDVKH